jgi:two-component system, NarL family, sensor histidine kinase UhpB
MSPATLAAPMQAAASEIYLIDADTLKLVDVNQAARQNLQYDHARLSAMTPLDLAPGMARAEFEALLASLGDEIGAQVGLRTCHQRADGSTYPIKLCFLRTVRDGRSFFVGIGDDLSLAEAAAAALHEYQARYNAVLNHTPGLVYQFLQHPDGTIGFPYLSEGCTALLGLPATKLQQDPSLFLQLVLAEDRKGYLDAMQESKANFSAWNWEGRIWIAAWHDVKWINLRATAQGLPDGTVQWDGIMTNITDSKNEHAELMASRARLAELTAHIEQVKEQERTRIAREIHDDLGGNLTAIKMALAMLTTRLPGDAALTDKAAYVDGLVDRTIDAVHRISLDLRPPTLDLGIVAALEWQALEFEKQAGIACVFRSPNKDIELDPDHAAALFRIFQEALTNIAKHARATRVSVTLRRERRQLLLTIRDNGCGIEPADRLKPQSFGLRGMSERARALGGTLALSPAPGGGTMVAVKIRLATPVAPRPARRTA